MAIFGKHQFTADLTLKKDIIHYDYIIIGAGAAGLMMADAMGKDDFFKESTILLLDREPKQNNDRTWCFWERGEGLFDHLIYRRWKKIYFGGQAFSKRFEILPYTYKMIRGIDFYTAYFKRIAHHGNITFIQESVIKVQDAGGKVVVGTDKNEYAAKKVLNSIYDNTIAISQNKYPVLQQHFLGWFIKSETAVFKQDQATFMDFSIPQKGNTRFMYLLPFSENEGLVEYTLFSEKLLPKASYEAAIKTYLQNDLGCSSYEILSREMGSIPMTCFAFDEQDTPNIKYIGTAGGWAKPSTGYTFMSTSKKIPILLDYIKTGKPLNQLSFKNKFWYYDLLLLDILHRDNGKGQLIFETLFKKRDPKLILKFLDEETNFWEDLKIISGCPKTAFIEAFIRRLLHF